MLIVFVSEEETAADHFRNFVKESRRHIVEDDFEFAFLYPSDLGLNIGNLRSLVESDFYRRN